MSYYVYILKSDIDGTFYKGSTGNYVKRLEEHNAGLCNYTSSKKPWSSMYVEEQPDKRTALIREKKLKRCKASYFEWLKDQSSNIIK
jgi:putative endonuclease